MHYKKKGFCSPFLNEKLYCDYNLPVFKKNVNKLLIVSRPIFLIESTRMIKYYAVQVRSRYEHKYTESFRLLHPQLPFNLFAPQRTINIRRQGKMRLTTSPVFSGYVFIEAEDDDSLFLHVQAFKKTPGFYRFLRSNQNICPIEGRDLELILHFIKKVGPVAGLSRVYFNEDSRIIVTDGPLLGLEGKIIKVDKRKGRAKIKLDLYDDSFSIDLPFEIMGRV